MKLNKQKMGKIFIICLMTICTYSSIAQTASVTQPKSASFFYIGFMKDSLPIYAEALNTWEESNGLPAFLFDYLYDIRLRGYWPAENQPTSFRKLILDQVTNKRVLHVIINYQSKLLDLSHSPSGSIFESDLGFGPPYYKYSTRELAEMRLDQLYMDRYIFDFD